MEKPFHGMKVFASRDEKKTSHGMKIFVSWDENIRLIR